MFLDHPALEPEVDFFGGEFADDPSQNPPRFALPDLKGRSRRGVEGRLTQVAVDELVIEIDDLSAVVVHCHTSEKIRSQLPPSILSISRSP